MNNMQVDLVKYNALNLWRIWEKYQLGIISKQAFYSRKWPRYSTIYNPIVFGEGIRQAKKLYKAQRIKS